MPEKAPPSSEHPRLSMLAWRPILILVMALGSAALVLSLLSRKDASRETERQAAQGADEGAAGMEAPTRPSSRVDGAGWPRFRGPGGRGIAASGDFPTHWNGADSGRENILWKSMIPYPGHSSPVVWNGRVFITGYEAGAHQGHVFCYDADSGAMLWRRAALAERPPDFEPPESLFEDAVGAASTMATDGRHVFAVFANGDLSAFDLDGRPVWSRHLGVPDSTYGYVSSPVAYGDRLLVQFDQMPESEDRFRSKLFAFDGATGRILFEVGRPVVDSWTSPIVIETETGSQIVTVASPWVIAYDPGSGREIWRVRMEGPDIAPSPSHAGGLVFAIVPNYEMIAVRDDGAGDITATHIAWTYDEIIPDTCSPVANDALVFLLSNGIVTCHDLADGALVWEQEFDSDFQSSPTLAGDRLYLLGCEGTMYIVSAGRTFEEIGRAELGEPSSCSPAFVDGRIYIRGEGHLFCIEEE